MLRILYTQGISKGSPGALLCQSPILLQSPELCCEFADFLWGTPTQGRFCLAPLASLYRKYLKKGSRKFFMLQYRCNINSRVYQHLRIERLTTLNWWFADLIYKNAESYTHQITIIDGVNCWMLGLKQHLHQADIVIELSAIFIHSLVSTKLHPMPRYLVQAFDESQTNTWMRIKNITIIFLCETCYRTD